MRFTLALLLVLPLLTCKAQQPDVNYYVCQWGPDFSLEMPNVFTPNSDFENDQFVPIVSNEICMDKYHLRIYNRYGEQVFESHVYSVGWDGMTIYGVPYAEGTYFYHTEIHYYAKEGGAAVERTSERKGSLLLVR